MTLAGFPHSGISGSLPTCGSPKLFAAYRALLRLSVPRHPPCALFRLTGYAYLPGHTAHFFGALPQLSLSLTLVFNEKHRSGVRWRVFDS